MWRIWTDKNTCNPWLPKAVASQWDLDWWTRFYLSQHQSVSHLRLRIGVSDTKNRWCLHTSRLFLNMVLFGNISFLFPPQNSTYFSTCHHRNFLANKPDLLERTCTDHNNFKSQSQLHPHMSNVSSSRVISHKEIIFKTPHITIQNILTHIIYHHQQES